MVGCAPAPRRPALHAFRLGSKEWRADGPAEVRIHRPRCRSTQARPTVPRDTWALLSGVAILLLAYLLFLIFKPFAVALVFAAVVAVVFHPLQVWLERQMPRSWASV